MKTLTRREWQDTGMALVLLLLLGAVVMKRDSLVLAAIVVHVVNMTIPRVFKPIAVVWLGAAHVLGNVMSTILLTVVYVVVVTPMGVVRRMTGKDTLRLRAFKAGDASVMVRRNHLFEARDLETPF